MAQLVTGQRGPELYRIAEGMLGRKWREQNPTGEGYVPQDTPDFFPQAKEGIDNGTITSQMLLGELQGGSVNPDGSLNFNANMDGDFDFGNVLLGAAGSAIMGPLAGELFSGVPTLTSGGTSALGGGQGGGMWDWLDEIIGEGQFSGGGTNDFFDPTQMDFGATPDFAAQALSGSNMGFTGGEAGGASATGITVPASFGEGSSGGILDAARRFLLGDPSGSGASPGGPRGIFGDPNGTVGGSGILGTAFNASPFILAAIQANNQRGDIQPFIDQITSAGSQLNPAAYAKSLTDPYDLATQQQRGALMQSLAERGVAGSSFGNMDLNNFDYTHGLGRADILNRGMATGAGLLGANAQAGAGMVNSRNASTNALLGQGLAASGSLFSPRQDPFDLRRLLGA